MNQTQRPWVTHKVILHAISKKLLTLITEILNKICLVTGPSLSSPCRRNQGLTKGLRWLNWHHRCSWRLQQNKLSRKRRRAAQGHPRLLGKLVQLASHEAPQLILVMILALLKLIPQFWLELLELCHPVASTWTRRLEIYGNPLPRAWSDNPKNWTLSSTEFFPIIGMWRPFSAR